MADWQISGEYMESCNCDYLYPDSAGTRTNRLPNREIGILLTE